MAKTIGRLSVLLTARTDRFVKNMSSASKRVGSLTRSLGSLAAKAGGVGAALAAVAGGGGMALLVKNSMSAMDATTKLASRLGATTKEVSGLQHAGALAGLSVEETNKSVEMFNRRLGEMQQGFGEGLRAAETLGIGLEDLQGMTLAEQMGLVADRMNGLESAGLKAAVSTQLFGRAGMKMGNLLQSGSEGIAAAIEEADKLGSAFDEVDGIRVEMANDSLHRLRQVFVGVANTLASEFAPWITAATERIVEFATRGDGVGSTITTAFGYIEAAGARVVKIMGLVAESMKLAQIAATKGAGIGAGLAGDLAGGFRKMIGSAALGEDLNAALIATEQMARLVEGEAGRRENKLLLEFADIDPDQMAKDFRSAMQSVRDRAESAAAVAAAQPRPSSMPDAGGEAQADRIISGVRNVVMEAQRKAAQETDRVANSLDEAVAIIAGIQRANFRPVVR